MDEETEQRGIDERETPQDERESLKERWKQQPPPPRDEYPYWGLKAYLIRVLGEQDPRVDLVRWNQDKPECCDTTFVNAWKRDVELSCPTLAAAIRSEEAHVRLMSGTWLAIRASWLPVWFGIVAASIVLGLSLLATSHQSLIGFSSNIGLIAAYFPLSFSALIGMWWAKRRIEELFHPRRVAELLSVLDAKIHVNDDPASELVAASRRVRKGAEL